MKRLLAALAFLVLATSATHPESRSQILTDIGTSFPTTGTGAITAATTRTFLTNLANSVFFTADHVTDVMDYGAVCDGSTDDAAAINSAITALRALAQGSNSQGSAALIFPENKACLIRSGINLTGWISSNGVFGLYVGRGYIKCATNGKPCIDALGSKGIYFDRIQVDGQQTNEPNIGIQIGRQGNSSVSADFLHFEKVAANGYFTFAAVYNNNSEGTTFENVIFKNYDGGADAYALVQDGYNHWNVASDFITVTAPVDTAQPFNDNLFLGGWFGVRGPPASGSSSTAAIWMGGGENHRFINSYVCAPCDGVGTPKYGVVLYFVTPANKAQYAQLQFGIHVEPSTITDVFYLTGNGSVTAPVLRGFSYQDVGPPHTNSIFKVDSATLTGGITAPDFHLKIGARVPDTAIKIFDDGTQWSISGHIYTPYNNDFLLSPPASFSGELCTEQAGCVVPNNNSLAWRNAANSANVNVLKLDNNNNIVMQAGASGVVAFLNNLVPNSAGLAQLGTNSLPFSHLFLNGHVVAANASQPVLTSCGTNPVLVGTDLAGEVTMGTGSPTGCVITFHLAYASTPFCTVTWQATPLASQSYAVSNSAITLTQTGTSSNKVNYICVAQNGG